MIIKDEGEGGRRERGRGRGNGSSLPIRLAIMSTSTKLCDLSPYYVPWQFSEWVGNLQLDRGSIPNSDRDSGSQDEESFSSLLVLAHKRLIILPVTSTIVIL